MSAMHFLSWQKWPEEATEAVRHLPGSGNEQAAAVFDPAHRDPDPQDPAWKTSALHASSIEGEIGAPSTRDSGGASPGVVASAIAWFAGHLQHGADGHLLHGSAGHLSSGCSGGSVCPTVCHGCPPTLTLTIAGIGGAGPACCIPALNGTFTLTQVGNDCNYSTGLFPQPRGCSFGWGLTCQSQDCNGIAGAGRWVLQLYGNITFVWAQLFPSSPCPPTGVFTICANPCTGGAGATVVLSS